jgi:hypothetical protein
VPFVMQSSVSSVIVASGPSRRTLRPLERSDSQSGRGVAPASQTTVIVSAESPARNSRPMGNPIDMEWDA